MNDQNVPPPEPGNEPSFSLYDFKQWMDSQGGGFSMPARRTNELVGRHVTSKIQSPKRLSKYLCVESGDLADLIRDFRRGGGRVIGVDAHYLTVEVDSGSFSIPGYFVTV